MNYLEILSKIGYVFYSPSVAGLAGSLASFLMAVRLGWVRNNHCVRKAFLELSGGLLTGTYLYPLVVILPPFAAAFILGAAWAGTIEQIRKWVTINVDKMLNQKDEPRGKTNKKKSGKQR